jgi:hypothetical protein
MNLDELVDQFLVRDSESNIHIGGSILQDISSFTQQSSIIEQIPPPNKPLAYLTKEPTSNLDLARRGNNVIMVSQAASNKDARNLTPAMSVNT